jgi:hypothetical protein
MRRVVIDPAVPDRASLDNEITGTVEVAEAAAELTAAGKIITVAGGGDTVAALNAAGAARRFTGSRCSGSDNGGLSTFSSRWMVGREGRCAKKSATMRPVLQIAVYDGVESVNKI